MSKRTSSTEKFIKNNSSFIFIVLAALGMSAVIWLNYQVYYNATNPPEESFINSSTPTSFDKATESKLDSLHTREDHNYNINIPSNQRVNPFSE